MEHGFEITIRGLIRKRAELAGRADVLNDQLTQALLELGYVDNALRLFDPSVEPGSIPVSAPHAPYAAIKGQTTRAILSMLRQGGRMTTQAIAEGIIEQRGLSKGDKRLVQTIQARTASALRKLRDRGAVASEDSGQGGGMLEWWLTSRAGEAGGGGMGVAEHARTNRGLSTR
jgi:hypothetical protein